MYGGLLIIQSYFPHIFSNKSLFIKFISTLLISAFSFATVNASWEISIAVILLVGKYFFSVIGIHPLPVPISNISTNCLGNILFINLCVH